MVVLGPNADLSKELASRLREWADELEGGQAHAMELCVKRAYAIGEYEAISIDFRVLRKQ